MKNNIDSTGKGKRGKAFSLVQIIVFSGFIITLAALCIILPDRKFSQQENRYLETCPEFSFSSLFSGRYMNDFESYVTDQFAFRDSWIGLKSASERATGKTENNNVFLCSDGTLITRFDTPDSELVEENISAVNELVKNTDVPVYFSLIPGAVSIWSYKLPQNAQNCDQKALIDSIYSRINASAVDNYSALQDHLDEYIYYRTDHHWTTLGAYYGFMALAGAMGFEPEDKDSYTVTDVTDDFYGTVYSSSGVRWVSPDSIDTYVSDSGVEITNYNEGKAESGVVYDYSKLDEKDKYSMFFGGNTPLLKINTGYEGLPHLLIIRDSYSDCETPFLFSHFSQIDVLDLRYYKKSVSDYIADNNIDTVLVNYSVANFTSDSNIFLIGK